MTPSLFTPCRLGGVEFPNRIAVAPMGQEAGKGGLVQPWHLQHIGHYAASAPGMVIMESGATDPYGFGVVGAIGLYTDEQEAALAKMVADVRTFSDTKLGMQIVHCGRKIPPGLLAGLREEIGLDNLDTYAPSAISFGGDYPVPIAFDEAGLENVKRGFVDSTIRSARCGFDLLEVHAAHGYLLHQFYSPLSNRRTGRYGGSVENMLRFPLEVAEAIREAWPPERALGIRINCIDYVSGDGAVDIAVALGCGVRDIGYDYICVTSGSIVERAQLSPSAPGYLVPVAERMRREAGLPVMVVGYIVDPHQAEAIVAAGKADFVGIARGFIDDPRWVWHAAAALGADVTYPHSYERARPDRWLGHQMMRDGTPTRSK